MKASPRLLLGLALLFAICGTFNSVSAQEDAAEIDFGFFYDRLAPHGDWVNTTEHGWSWQPRDVEADFRPYTKGSWAYTEDSGWFWQSASEWGWAAEHYGRWAQVDSKWHWIPGYEWSGAWVSWRNGEEHIGWAPLPPRAKWEARRGLSTDNFNHETDIPRSSWVFVKHSDFTASNVNDVKIKDSEVATVMRQAPVAGSVTVSSGKIVNNAIPLETAVEFTGKEIETKKLLNSNTLGGLSVECEHNEIRVFRPTVKEGDATPPAKGDNRRIADALRKTMQERHEAERKNLEERVTNSDMHEGQRRYARTELERRQKQESEEFERKHARDRERPAREPEEGEGRRPERVPERNPERRPERDSDN